MGSEKGGDMSVSLSQDLQRRGICNQTSSDELNALLDTSSLSLYAGFDPTADSLHIGNLFLLLTLRRFQLAGHRPVLVAGGGTGMIGDPSGKESERTLLSEDELDRNLEALTRQLGRFVDLDDRSAQSAKIVDNRTWLSELSLIEFLRDAGKHFNVNHMLQKDSVRNRLGIDRGFSFTEFTYMLLQSYDFLQLYRSPLHVTLQLGGSDQWGNITTGIDFVRKVEGATVYGMTTPLVTRADGRKFGKSESGAVWLDANKTTPFELYQFFLRSEDEMVISYLRYFTFLSLEEIDALEEGQREAPEKRAAHQRLAYEVTELVHGRDDAARAEEASRLIYGEGDISSAPLDTIRLAFSEAPQQSLSRREIESGIAVDDFAGRTPLFGSKSEARRVISQGGLYLNGHRVSEAGATVTEDELLHNAVIVLRRGKREYCLVEFE